MKKAGKGLVKASAILPALAEGKDIAISKRKLKRLEVIELVRDSRDGKQQNVGVSSRPFVLCGLPIKRPKKGVLVYRRQNGRYVLEIVGHPEYGLPFGQDRLLPIWLATVAAVNRNPVVQFDSAAEILDLFDLPKDGKTYRRLVEGFQRLFTASIFFGTRDELRDGRVFDMERVHYFRRMQLWYSRKVHDRNLPGFQNQIVLSEWFWSEIQEHPIPIDITVVRGLADSPGALDFYVWVCWRTWTVKSGQTAVPLFGVDGLVKQLGVEGYAQRQKFRQTLRRWIATTQALWPECPVELSGDGNALILRHGKAIEG